MRAELSLGFFLLFLCVSGSFDKAVVGAIDTAVRVQ
jgi:hypothetical protein